MRSSSKAEKPQAFMCCGRNFNSCLDLQTQDVKHHTFVLLSEKGNGNTKERDVTGI